MSAFIEISGFNLYLQIAVTIISISVHLFNTRNKQRTESVIEIITIYTIGLSGWFSIPYPSQKPGFCLHGRYY